MVKPEDVGFSSEQLDKIETHFQGRVDRGEIAGIVTRHYGDRAARIA